MALTRETVSAWLRSYVDAWTTYDGEAIAGLFTEDAIYRFHPFDDPVRGRLAIVASWLQGKDPEGTYDANHQPIVIEDNLAVANGRSRYFKDSSKAELEREYDNLFLIRFDDEGRSRSFEEWYVGRRGQR